MRTKSHQKNNIITIGIVDSGQSDYYAASKSEVANISTSTNVKTEFLPNGDTTQSSHKAQLKLNKLTLQTRSCQMFPTMKDKVLISLGKLCDNGMEAHRTKEKSSSQNKIIKRNNERKPRLHHWNVVSRS